MVTGWDATGSADGCMSRRRLRIARNDSDGASAPRIGQLEELPGLEPHRPGDRHHVLHLELDRSGEEAAHIAWREPQPPLDLAVRQPKQPDRRPEDVQQPLDFVLIAHVEIVPRARNMAQEYVQRLLLTGNALIG